MEQTALQLVTEDGLATTKKRQQLTKIDDKTKIATKGFRTDYFEEHLDDHLLNRNETEQWCNPDCMARIIFGRTSEGYRRAIRQRLSRQFREMLKRGKFLAVEFAPRTGRTNGEATAFRFVVPGESGLAYQCSMDRLQRMRSRLRLTEHELTIAQQLLGLVDAE